MGICCSVSRPPRPPLLPFLSTPFANYLTKAQLHTFSVYFTELSFSPSSLIFNAGDTAGDYFIFLSGKAHVFADHKFLCEKTKGDTINTTAITSDHLTSTHRHPPLPSSPLPRHTCSLHAITSTRLLYLSHHKLIEYIHNNPETSNLLLPLFSSPFVSLSSLSFFQSMASSHLHILSSYLLRMQALKPQEILFMEGSLGQSVYILQAGQLKAVAAVKEGGGGGGGGLEEQDDGEKVLHIFKYSNPDDRIFGEIALIMDIPRTASIISMSHSIVLEWKREDYKNFLSLSSTQTQHIQRIMKARTAEHFRKYKVPFFASIPDEKYAILASLCQVEERGAGEIIFKEGERGSQFYLIAYGQVTVTVKKKRKKETTATSSSPSRHIINSSSSSTSSTSSPLSATSPKSPTSPSYPSSPSSTGTMKRKLTRETMKGFNGTFHRPSPSSLYNSSRLPVPSDDVEESVEICRMGPGKYFGEIALVQDTPRTATVTTLSRCIILSITKENFQIFFHEAPEAIADFEIKLARYDVALRSVLYHPLGLQYFRRHCEREYAAENVDFWLKCRNFRHLSRESMEKEKEEKRKERRKERRKGEKSQQAEGGVKVNRKEEETTAAEESQLEKEEVETTECIDSDYCDETEDSADITFIQQISNGHEDYLLNQISSLFTVFSPISSITTVTDRSKKANEMTALTLTTHQLKSLLLMLDISINDSMLEELTSHLNVSEELISYTHFINSMTLLPMPSLSSNSKVTRLLRKVYRRICQYDLCGIRKSFENCSQTNKGFINLLEFQQLLRSMQIKVRGDRKTECVSNNNDNNNNNNNNVNDEKDVSLLFSRLASPLSFSTGMSPNEVFVSFPVVLSFLLNHFHSHEQFYSQMVHSAKLIYNNYIAETAKSQVNIKSQTSKRIEKAMNQLMEIERRPIALSIEERVQRWTQIGVELFIEAEEEILDLLASDPFARFKQSELFQQFLSSAQAYVEVKGGKGAVGDNEGRRGEREEEKEEEEEMIPFGEEIRQGTTRGGIMKLRSGSIRGAGGGRGHNMEKRTHLTIPSAAAAPPPPPFFPSSVRSLPISADSSSSLHRTASPLFNSARDSSGGSVDGNINNSNSTNTTNTTTTTTTTITTANTTNNNNNSRKLLTVSPGCDTSDIAAVSKQPREEIKEAAFIGAELVQIHLCDAFQSRS